MGGASAFLTPDDLRRISNLQVLARLVVEGFCAGLHRSPHKGFSVEFRQHRQYVQGDDLRRLDWKVFGKSDRFFVREYEEETNLRATLLVDVSGSMAYGGGAGGALSKHGYAVRAAACLAYLMLGQQDSVGLVTFDTAVRSYIPPRARPGHLQAIIDELSSRSTGGETALSTVFHQITPKLRRRALVILISDCFDDAAALLRALAHLRHAGNEVIVFQVWHRDELEFPFSGCTRFDCLERAGLRHVVDGAHLRAAYLANVARFRETLLHGCRRHRVDLVPLVTDQPYAEVLARYLAARKRRP